MNIIYTGEKDTRLYKNVLGETISQILADDPRAVYLDADLMSCIGTAKLPGKTERAIDCGIAEANMIGIACGLSAVGMHPIAHTFGPFASRRCFDQIFLSGGYAKNSVTVIGTDPGVTAAFNGGTHMPFEDMGIMRLIPEMTVIEPTDVSMLEDLMPQIAAQYGMVYMRLVRKEVQQVYERGSQFTIGKAVRVREGSDATIIASGFCVAEAIRAAELLAQEGVSVRIVDMFTWKPLDREAILSAAAETGAIVTAENHNVINGLGAAVAEVLVRERPVPVEMVGVQDEFGEVGKLAYLAERFGLKAENIADAVRRVLKRK